MMVAPKNQPLTDEHSLRIAAALKSEAIKAWKAVNVYAPSPIKYVVVMERHFAPASWSPSTGTITVTAKLTRTVDPATIGTPRFAKQHAQLAGAFFHEIAHVLHSTPRLEEMARRLTARQRRTVIALEEGRAETIAWVTAAYSPAAREAMRIGLPAIVLGEVKEEREASGSMAALCHLVALIGRRVDAGVFPLSNEAVAMAWSQLATAIGGEVLAEFAIIWEKFQMVANDDWARLAVVADEWNAIVDRLKGDEKPEDGGDEGGDEKPEGGESGDEGGESGDGGSESGGEPSEEGGDEGGSEGGSEGGESGDSGDGGSESGESGESGGDADGSGEDGGEGDGSGKDGGDGSGEDGQHTFKNNNAGRQGQFNSGEHSEADDALDRVLESLQEAVDSLKEEAEEVLTKLTTASRKDTAKAHGERRREVGRLRNRWIED